MSEALSETPAARRRKQYYSVGDAIWGCRLIGGSAKLVALRLGKNWPRIFPAIATLCEDTGLSERTVRDALRELERKEVIQTTRRPGTSSLYAFVGVSIPELGADSDGGSSEPVPRQITPPPLPRQIAPPRPADSAPPVRQISPPNSRRLTLEPKELGSARARKRGKPLAPTPIFHTSLEGWEPSASLRAEARRLGLDDAAFDARIKRMRLTRIGGRGGVSDRDGYISGWLEQWARWEAENLEKAQRRAGMTPRTGFWGGSGGWEPSQQMKAYAGKYGLDIESLASAFVRSGEAAERGGRKDADDAFIKRLIAAKRAKLMSDPREVRAA